MDRASIPDTRQYSCCPQGGQQIAWSANLTCNNEVINFHYFLASSIFLYPITRRHCFTLEYESNSFAHDLPFQLHGKAEQKMEPQRERDKYIKQTKKLFIISFVQPCLMLFFLSQNTNVGSSSLHLSLISSVGSKDNC